MKHGHLTEQRKHFVEAYCRLGNGTLAAKEAGYKDSPSLVNQASKLKRELSAEISEELRSSFMNAAPKALSILMDLAENSAFKPVHIALSAIKLKGISFSVENFLIKNDVMVYKKECLLHPRSWHMNHRLREHTIFYK